VRQAFGVTEVELEKELRQYVQQMAFPSARYAFQDTVAIDKGWTVDQPSDADGEAAYADLLLALHRPADATARADAALKLAPGHARAQAVLGRIRAADGETEPAATLLDQAVKAAGETDYLPAYYQARLLLRGEGKHSPTPTPASARQALALLGRVTTLQPSLADAHGLAAYAWLVADNPNASMAAAATAFKLSPRHEYALLHARARVFLRDAGVRPALDALVARGSSDWVKREAQELIDFLGRVQASEASRKALAASLGLDAARSTSGPADVPGMPGGGGGSGRVIPVYRVLKGAEKRDIGLFTGIECPRGGIVFTFKGGAQVARLSAKAFDQVEMLTYRQEPPGSVSCGPRAKPELVYYTWLAEGGAPGTTGVLTALELLPEDFQP
jgi:tetratricopeptide (TPR) repeat protein